MGLYQILFETTEGKTITGQMLANNSDEARKRAEKDLSDKNGLKRIVEVKEG
ncbi:hypothetical protein [Ammoniphilus resinae]|uniref:DUF1508 domain-containing protein n=1 Tax=Ammoniphilus resinae TaxID=861532 RepID=A0ABS4GMR9_9BACL|nr:hypothetical protein [Ammoniphilus resinae]MBP1931577.1 hypothetical protein [Ammoniphilus resinae]